MPNRDKTGPYGDGPATGRGLGPCGRGSGWRAGIGCRRSFRPWTKEEELSVLKEEKKIMEEESKEINERIKELEE